MGASSKARPRRIGRSSHKRIRNITLRENTSGGFVIAVALVVIAMIVAIVWLTYHPWSHNH